MRSIAKYLLGICWVYTPNTDTYSEFANYPASTIIKENLRSHSLVPILSDLLESTPTQEQ